MATISTPSRFSIAPRRQAEELLFATGRAADDRKLQRRALAGELQRIGSGIYVPAGDEASVKNVVRRGWQRLAAHVAPGAVVSHLSAMGGGITSDSDVTLSHPSRFNRKVAFPGLTVILLEGPRPLPGDFKLGAHDLYWASPVRMLLENLTRGSATTRAGRAMVEEHLVAHLNVSKEEGLRRIRDTARALAPALRAEAAFKTLNALVGALLSTYPKGELKTSAGRLVAAGTPADVARLSLFEQLATHLRIETLPSLEDVAAVGDARVNFTFLESYFSNYVEGIRFSVAEAKEIVMHSKVVARRSIDSHDIIGVFELAHMAEYRAVVPPPGSEFVDALQARHHKMLARRQESRPGELKLELNHAGTTPFVAPALVRGTLAGGSRLAMSVPEGLARAAFYLFVVTEVHPFDDGNGRIARLLMNAELSRVGHCRVIIPTLFHPQLVDCLRVLSQRRDGAPFVEAVARMATWSAQFDYGRLNLLVERLRACNAFEESPAQYRLLNLDGSRVSLKLT